MDFTGLIAEFGVRYGIGELAPDANGVVGIAVDGRQMILQPLSEGENIVTISLEVGDAPEKGSAIVNRLIMKANRALFLLDGMAIVLHSESGRYCLLARCDVSALDFAGFDALIARVLERADQWGQVFEKILPVAAEAENSPGAVGELPDLALAEGFLQV